MAGVKGNKKHANKTSFPNQYYEYEKWTEKAVFEILFKMLENAEKDENILCLQDAIISVKLYSSSLTYLIDKFPKFVNIKSDIQNVITSRINKNALTGEFNATASIWRMKQLGEVDKQEVKTHNINENNDVTIKIVKE